VKENNRLTKESLEAEDLEKKYKIRGGIGGDANNSPGRRERKRSSGFASLGSGGDVCEQDDDLSTGNKADVESVWGRFGRWIGQDAESSARAAVKTDDVSIADPDDDSAGTKFNATSGTSLPQLQARTSNKTNQTINLPKAGQELNLFTEGEIRSSLGTVSRGLLISAISVEKIFEQGVRLVLAGRVVDVENQDHWLFETGLAGGRKTGGRKPVKTVTSGAKNGDEGESVLQTARGKFRPCRILQDAEIQSFLRDGIETTSGFFAVPKGFGADVNTAGVVGTQATPADGNPETPATPASTPASPAVSETTISSTPASSAKVNMKPSEGTNGNVGIGKNNIGNTKQDVYHRDILASTIETVSTLICGAELDRVVFGLSRLEFSVRWCEQVDHMIEEEGGVV
jgi:hypothetical protein